MKKLTTKVLEEELSATLRKLDVYKHNYRYCVAHATIVETRWGPADRWRVIAVGRTKKQALLAAYQEAFKQGYLTKIYRVLYLK